MGKDKKKKKVSGMEKTLAKTEKKIDKAIKKELDEIGEVRKRFSLLLKCSWMSTVISGESSFRETSVVFTYA